jgi:hypothetical protein
MLEGEGEESLAKLPQESFDEMIMRHREALDDIFDNYNQFIMKESPSRASYVPSFSHSNTNTKNQQHYSPRQ